jgi:hypothetical protein
MGGPPRHVYKYNQSPLSTVVRVGVCGVLMMDSLPCLDTIRGLAAGVCNLPFSSHIPRACHGLGRGPLGWLIFTSAFFGCGASAGGKCPRTCFRLLKKHVKQRTKGEKCYHGETKTLDCLIKFGETYRNLVWWRSSCHYESGLETLGTHAFMDATPTSCYADGLDFFPLL